MAQRERLEQVLRPRRAIGRDRQAEAEHAVVGQSGREDVRAQVELAPAVRPAGLSDSGATLVRTDDRDPVSQEIFAHAMSSTEVAAKVMRGLRRNDLYIITHAEIRATIEARLQALLAALPDESVPAGRARSSAVLYDVPVYAEQSAKPAPQGDR